MIGLVRWLPRPAVVLLLTARGTAGFEAVAKSPLPAPPAYMVPDGYVTQS